jgi:hypothetical protein
MSVYIMPIRCLIIVACLLVIASGCNYAPMGYISKQKSNSESVGYEETALDSTTFQVVYESGGESMEVTERYALFRAAELTIEKGFDSFIVLESNPSTMTGTRSIPTGPRGKPITYNWAHHTAVKTIRFRKGKLPDEMSGYDAKSLIATMGPNINRATVDR